MSPERREGLFENSILPMLLLDLETASVVEANPAAAVFYGYSRDEMAGMPVSDLETLEPEVVDGLMRRQRETPKEHARALQHRLADGRVRDVDVRMMLGSEEPGKTAYVVVLDITAQQAAFRELDEHRARLRALLEEQQGSD